MYQKFFNAYSSSFDITAFLYTLPEKILENLENEVLKNLTENYKTLQFLHLQTFKKLNYGINYLIQSENVMLPFKTTYLKLK